MRRAIVLLFLLALFPLVSAAQGGRYLFVWAGDDAKQGQDFLAVIDADPASAGYGRAVASVAVPGPSGGPHHTELEMPEGGFLLANAFGSGRTHLFDLRQPLTPRLVTSFGDLDGFSHPHTYVRLPNGHVLATFQYEGAHGGRDAPGGGLVEFDQRGRILRSRRATDPAAKGELIRPYSLVVLPERDRVVSTNTAMHETEGDTRTVQVWRLTDLSLMKTLVLPAAPGRSVEKNPGEPRVLADGRTVLIHTFSCGLYRLEDVETDEPVVRHVAAFEGAECAVPLRIGRYWIQTLFSAHAVAVYDVSDPARAREVSRVTLDGKQKPHWIAADPSGRRIALNSGEYGDHRLYLLDFDPASGTLTLDARFRDAGSDRPGVSLDGKAWPHGWRGDAYPHGTVFSR